MKKIVIQGVLIVLSFFMTWFVLYQVDWMKVFKIQQAKENVEVKLGELLLEVFKRSDNENTNEFVTQTMDSLLTKICTSNQIDQDQIKLHVLRSSDVNAFALPNGHLIVFSDLISEAENQEELCGVICHEIAHIEKNHVMQKLIKEVGLSVLISMTTNGNGTGMIKETAKMLSSTAFDRKLEQEADLLAVEYLKEAGINPEPFANFMYKLAADGGKSPRFISWISTHPDSNERALEIIQAIGKDSLVYHQVIADTTWKKLIETVKISD